MSGEMPPGGRVVQFLTPKERAQVQRALVLVEKRARYHGRKYVGLIDPEELVTVGKIGAVEVVRRYDETRDASFEAYLLARIDGQMLSLIRSTAKEKQKDLAMKRAAARFRAHHHGEYDILKEGPEALRGRLQTFSDDVVAAAFLAALEEKRRAAPDEDVAECAEVARAMRVLADALVELSEDERTVLGAIYVDDMDMREAEAHLGVPYITVRRRHARAQEKLRKALIRRGMRRAAELRDFEGVAPVLLGVKGNGQAGGTGGTGGTGGAPEQRPRERSGL